MFWSVRSKNLLHTPRTWHLPTRKMWTTLKGLPSFSSRFAVVGAPGVRFVTQPLASNLCSQLTIVLCGVIRLCPGTFKLKQRTAPCQGSGGPMFCTPPVHCHWRGWQTALHRHLLGVQQTLHRTPFLGQKYIFRCVCGLSATQHIGLNPT